MQGVKRDMVAYPGCRSLRSLALGWSQTLLCRVWLGFQPVIINVVCAFGAAAPAAIFAGVQPSRLTLRELHAIRGRCPRLLTVQPSRLRYSLRLFDSSTLPLFVFSSLRLLVP